jgi:two-component system chemotaxis response regulator CheY
MFDLKTKVLIVDDMSSMRKLVAKICQEIGFTDILEVADGTLAWKAIQESRPFIGLVISDWEMPNCSGLDLARRIRGDSRFQKTPFVLLSEETAGPKVMEAMKTGIDGYVIKPFTTATLTEKLEAAAKKRLGAG